MNNPLECERDVKTNMNASLCEMMAEQLGGTHTTAAVCSISNAIMSKEKNEPILDS